MVTASKAEVTQQFLTIARRWVGGDMTARQLIDAFVKFYREVRVSDVDLENGDKLLLDSSRACAHHLIDEPTDLTNTADADLRFSTERYRYLGLSREFWPPEPDWDDEGDDDDSDDEFGIGLSLFMFFALPAATDSHSTHRVSSPGELDEPLKEYLAHPLVAEVLDRCPTKVTCFGSKIG